MKSKRNYQYIYTELTKVFQKKPWLKAYKDLTGGGQQVTLKKLADYIITYGLYLWESHEQRKLDEYEWSIVADAMFCCNLFLSIYHSFDNDEKNQFFSRFKAAFSQPNDMRAINFELFICFYLINKKYTVQSKDDEKTGETFDYLVKNSLGQEIQVECKSFSYDKGLYLTAEEAQTLYGLILDREHNLNCNYDNKIAVYTFEMCQVFPKSTTSINQLIDNIISALKYPENDTNNKFKIHIEEFHEVQDINEADAHLKLQHQDHGIELGRIVSMPDGNKGRFCLRITTHIKDSFLRDFESICKRAAKTQLLKDKPASIAVHVSNFEILKYLHSDNRFSNKLNNIFEQKHLISLVFFSNTQGDIALDGSYFYAEPIVKEFKNPNSKFNEIKGLLS